MDNKIPGIKIDRLETHDRFQHFTKQSFDISEQCQRIVNQKPFGNHPFYIFVHARTYGLDEKLTLINLSFAKSLTDLNYIHKYKSLEDVPEKKIIWQPRLTKPKAESNSMLFKAYPGTDVIKIIWMIPAVELWEQFEKGKMTENQFICESIQAYKTNRESLERKEDDDLSDNRIDQIYREISLESKRNRQMEKLYPKLSSENSFLDNSVPKI